jgi:ketosteroid isomerase-like protein
MSQANVEIVRARYEEFASGDFRRLADVADDYEFVTAREMPDAGTYRGAAAREWIESWVDSFDGLKIEVTEIVDAGDKVFSAVLQRGRIRESQTPVETRSWVVDSFRDGVAVRTEAFFDRAQALEAAGLRE